MIEQHKKVFLNLFRLFLKMQRIQKFAAILSVELENHNFTINIFKLLDRRLLPACYSLKVAISNNKKHNIFEVTAKYKQTF